MARRTTPTPADTATTVAEVLGWLQQRGTQQNRDGMDRFAIRSAKRFGVSMATMRPLIRKLGHQHELAWALWETGWLEARILASFVDEPSRVTPGQMEAWAREFDNWAVCDSVCCHLFDRTPYAWTLVTRWSRRRAEFIRRGAFATLAGLAVHDKQASDTQFIAMLPLIERTADDDRNFVKKAVNWALRQIGKRNAVLHREAIAVAERLIRRPESSARWIGHDALGELRSAPVVARLEKRSDRKISGRRGGGR